MAVRYLQSSGVAQRMSIAVGGSSMQFDFCRLLDPYALLHASVRDLKLSSCLGRGQQSIENIHIAHFDCFVGCLAVFGEGQLAPPRFFCR